LRVLGIEAPVKYASPLLNTPQLNKSTRAFNGVNLAVTDVNLTWQAVVNMPQLNRKGRFNPDEMAFAPVE